MADRRIVPSLVALLALALLPACDRRDPYDERVGPQARDLFDARIRHVFADPAARRVTFSTSPEELADDADLVAVFRKLGYLARGAPPAFSPAGLRASTACGRYEPAGCRRFPVADAEFGDSYAFRRGPKTWHATNSVRVRVHVRDRPVGALGAAIAAARIFQCPRDGDLESWAGETTLSDSTVWLTFRAFPSDETIDDLAPGVASASVRITRACPETHLDAGANALIAVDEYGGEYE